MEKRIAIIGAGMAGLGVAWRLNACGKGNEVVVFEKSRGLGGRVASRTREGVRVDIGANYFRLGDGVFGDVVRDQLGGAGVLEIGRPVWLLGADGTISPGEPRSEVGGKWVYADGISTLAKRLVAESGVEVEREVRVARVERHDGGWQLWAEGGDELGEFDVVVWTAPVPQVVEVMRASAVDSGWWGGLMEELGAVEFLPQFSVVLGYRKAPVRPGEYYGLVNVDGGHDVGWLSFEDDKAGRVSRGGSVLVVQMSARWSGANYDGEKSEVVEAVLEKVGGILGDGWNAADWWDVQRWRFARPAGGGVVGGGVVGGAALAAAEGGGWFLAGDGIVGKARIGLAFENGIEVGGRVAMFLDGAGA